MYVGFIFASVFIGYAQGCAPIISYHYGAENHDELKNLFRKSITMLAIAGVAMFTSAQLMATPLAKMFVGYDAGLMELTEHALKLYAFSFLLCGFNIFSSAFFTALNNGAISAAISFLRTLVFQVFAVLVLPMVLDIDGIWYALVFAEAAALLRFGGATGQEPESVSLRLISAFTMCLIGPAHLAAGAFYNGIFPLKMHRKLTKMLTHRGFRFILLA